MARQTRAHPPGDGEEQPKYPTIRRVTRCVRRQGILLWEGRPTRPVSPVRTHGGPSLARPARAVVLSLLSVLVQPRSGCPSREAIADDQVQWYSVVALHEQELEILFCNLSCKTGRAWSILVVVQGSEESTAFFVFFVPITIFEARGLSLRGVGLPQSLLVTDGGTLRSSSKRLHGSRHVVVVTVASS